MNIDRVVTKLFLLRLIRCWCYQGDFAHLNLIMTLGIIKLYYVERACDSAGSLQIALSSEPAISRG